MAAPRLQLASISGDPRPVDAARIRGHRGGLDGHRTWTAAVDRLGGDGHVGSGDTHAGAGGIACRRHDGLLRAGGGLWPACFAPMTWISTLRGTDRVPL